MFHEPRRKDTYRVVALTGNPRNLRQGDTVEVTITTGSEEAGAHMVYFNRGVPEGKTWTWLSKGLLEGLLRLIDQAKNKTHGLRAAFCEFQYPPVLKAFDEARTRGADVKIVVDARQNVMNDPNAKNRAAIADAGIDDLIIPRESNPSYIAHNKFCNASTRNNDENMLSTSGTS